MPSLDDYFIKQLEDISTEFDEIVRTSSYDDLSSVPTENLVQLITRSKAVIKRITGPDSEYYKLTNQTLPLTEAARGIIGIVRALLHDLKAGYLKNLTEIIHAEMFSDFLEMAEYLLSEGYKDAAAVIAGSTLEGHLKKLCNKNLIQITYTDVSGKIKPKKADTLNNELSKVAYNLNEQKQVTAWLGIRNDAAHGDYSKYDAKKVEFMIMGIRNFISINPA